MATAAFEELEKSQKAIRKKLVRAGFVDCLPTEMLAGKITPGMIHGHPAVIAARTRHDELRGRSVEFLAAKKTGDTSRT